MFKGILGLWRLEKKEIKTENECITCLGQVESAT